MRQQTRALAGIGILAIGVGAWYFTSRDSANENQQPAGVPLARLDQPEEPSSPAAETRDTSTEQGLRPIAANGTAGLDSETGSSASPPPPLALPNLEERSFRPPIDTTHTAPPSPSQRTGLTAPGLAGPSLAHAADPVEDDIEAADDPAEEVALSDAPDADLVPAVGVATTRPAAAEAKPKVIEHVIQPGDAYSSLAVKYLGGVRHTNLIVKANPDKDPRRLFVGSKVIIPALPEAPQADAARPAQGSAVPTASRQPAEAVAAASAPPVPPDRAYQVQPGESWSDLARKFLGDANQWPRLYELNKDRVVRDPSGLRAGTTIELPADVVASATRP
jgi:nucleoid-associated protein YgaU